MPYAALKKLNETIESGETAPTNSEHLNQSKSSTPSVAAAADNNNNKREDYNAVDISEIPRDETTAGGDCDGHMEEEALDKFDEPTEVFPTTSKPCWNNQFSSESTSSKKNSLSEVLR